LRSSRFCTAPRRPCSTKAGLEKVKVTAKVVAHVRGEKLRVFKFKPKRGYKRRNGHRQDLTQIEVTRHHGRSRETAAAKTGGESSGQPAGKKRRRLQKRKRRRRWLHKKGLGSSRNGPRLQRAAPGREDVRGQTVTGRDHRAPAGTRFKPGAAWASARRHALRARRGQPCSSRSAGAGRMVNILPPATRPEAGQVLARRVPGHSPPGASRWEWRCWRRPRR